MPISRAILGLGLLALAACAGGNPVTRDAPQRIALPDGMVVAGADGWCIDRSTSRTGVETSVVVLGGCAAISGNALRPQPDVQGVVTVSVENEAGKLPNGETLRSFFATEAGRAALARNGRPESVRIIESRSESDLVYLRAADSSIGQAAAPETWRAVFGLKGRFVSISLYGPADQPIDPEDGFDAIAEQVKELRRANRG